mmetsp:Transcript_42326/g.99429  ORF Transcript_42326/g.99429 Transcript_42326/m.99429 type:complete len:417 (-) Transcript_42326:2726-3976(-)
MRPQSSQVWQIVRARRSQRSSGKADGISPGATAGLISLPAGRDRGGCPAAAGLQTARVAPVQARWLPRQPERIVATSRRQFGGTDVDPGLGQIGGQRRLQPQGLTGDRMAEAEPGRMQGLTGQAQRRRAAVERVGQQRMAAVHQVDADLMGPAGVQHAMHGADGPPLRVTHPQRKHIGARRLAEVGRCDGHLHPRHRVAPQGLVDDEGLVDTPPGQRQVFAVHFASGDLARQRGDGFQRLADHHQAAGVLVEAVHDARTRQPRRRRMVGQQPVHQRARPVARGRVHDQPGRLVHDHQVLILVGQGQHHRLGAEGPALVGWLQFHLDALASAQLQRRLEQHDAVGLHTTPLDQGLQMVARELRREAGQPAVQPLAVTRGIDLGRAPLGRALALDNLAGFVFRVIETPRPILRAHCSV